MIYYVVTRDHAYTLGGFLQYWAPGLASRIQIVAVDQLLASGQVFAGTYVFTDHDRYTPDERAWLAEAADAIQAKGRGLALNHPGQVIDRLALLRLRHQAGANLFGAWRWPVPPERKLRFPVFLRTNRGHAGPLSGLLSTPAELAAAAAPLAARYGDDLILVEHQSVRSPDALYRKYSAFRVGEAIVPRHMLFSRDWVQKYPDTVDPALQREEDGYIATNPHEAELREIFDTAGVEYGRIDYGVDPATGRLQVWEINTNPVIVRGPGEVAPARLPAHAFAMTRLHQAFLALDPDAPQAAAPALPLDA